MADDFGWSAAADEPAKSEFGWSQEQPALPPGYTADQSPAALRQKGWEDFDLPTNIVNQFTAGVERVKKAVEANRDPDQPWYQPLKTGWNIGAGAIEAASAPVSAVMQAAGGAVEKASFGLIPSGDAQTAMMLAPFMPKVKLVAPLAETVPSVIRPIEGSPNPGVARSVAAKTGVPEIDAVLEHATIKAVIDNPVVDRSHTIPYEAGGSVPVDKPTTYLDQHVPESFTTKRLSDPTQTVTYDPAEPTIIHENVEEFVMERLIKSNVYHGTNKEFTEFDQSRLQSASGSKDAAHGFYFTDDPEIASFFADNPKTGRVIAAKLDIKNPKEITLDPDSSLDKSETIKQAFKAGYDAVVFKNSNEGKGPVSTTYVVPRADQIKAGWTPQEAYRVAHFGWAQEAEHAWYRFHDIDPEGAEAEWKKIQPGIQHEIASDTPADLYHKEYPGGDVTAARHEDVFEAKPTPDEMARARDVIRNDPELRPADPMAAAKEARDLGVIGPEKPPATEGTPAQAAARATEPAIGSAPPKPPPEGAIANPARDKAGNIRLDQIGINADAKDVIIKAAETNDDFMAARRGEVPLAQVSSLSEATGIPITTLQGNDGLGRLMHNDAVVRTWLQAFHQASDEIAAQMAKVKLSGDAKDIEDLREMKLRFQHMQEQVSGLTAEAGRTLRVFRDFYDAKGKAEDIGKLLADNPGNDAASLKKLAAAGAELDRTQLPKWLNDQRKPNWWDWAQFYWINALISGPITHTKYIFANGVFAGFEHGVTTPIAAAIGKARALVSPGADRVLMGEAPAALWGMVQGTPDAIVAAAKAFRSGMKTPTPGDIAQAMADAKAKGLPPPTPESIAQSMSPFMGTKMVQGAHTETAAGKVAVTALSVPMRSASGIHSFFNFIGYSARVQRDAYRAAVKEGLSPTDGNFYARLAHHADNPSQETMGHGIQDGARMTFMRDGGDWNKALTALANKPWIGPVAPLKLIMPFTKIPLDIMRSTVEHTPLALSTMLAQDSELGGILRGEKGAVAQDTAFARIAGGSALMAFAVNWAMNDRVTGDGPRDPKERELWMLSHQPNSVRIGDTWVSFDKFGPAGNLMRLGANFAEVAPHLAAQNDDDLTKAASLSIYAASKIVIDETGMMGLSDMIQAAADPDHKGARFMSNFASSWLPYSSALGQTASIMDPEMRQAKSFTDGIKYRIPGQRETLYPVRDWSGQVVANPAYGNILRQKPVNQDPVDLELQNLNYAPAPPTDRIGQVKLTPKLADEYRATAGAMTRSSLESLVHQPGWYDMPPYAREQVIRSMIKGSRASAAATMQARYPQIIQQGVENKINRLSGVPPKPLQQ